MSQSKRWVFGLYILFSLGGLVAGCMTRSGDMPDRDAAAISQVMRGLNKHDPKR